MAASNGGSDGAFVEDEDQINDFQIVGAGATRNDPNVQRYGNRRSTCPTFWPK
jgi:hypothetical protein